MDLRIRHGSLKLTSGRSQRLSATATLSLSLSLSLLCVCLCVYDVCVGMCGCVSKRLCAV